MYLQQKMIRIYADIVQNPNFLGLFGGQCKNIYIYIITFIVPSIVSKTEYSVLWEKLADQCFCI